MPAYGLVLRMFCVQLRKCILYCLEMENSLYMLIMSICSSYVSYFLIDFCLDDLSIVVKGIFRSLTITVFLSFSPFRSVSNCFIYLVLPGWVHINKCYVFLMNCPLYHYTMSIFVSYCLFFFVLKSVLSDMNVAIPAFLWISFLESYLLPLHFKPIFFFFW